LAFLEAFGVLLGSGWCVENSGEFDSHDIINSLLEFLEVAFNFAGSHTLLDYFFTFGLQLLP
jgi:hypothetical protein